MPKVIPRGEARVSRKAQQLVRLRQRLAIIKRGIARQQARYDKITSRFECASSEQISIETRIRHIEKQLNPDQREDYELLKARAVANALMAEGK